MRRQLAVDHREHNPSRTMRRDEAAALPRSSVAIISEPISANENLSSLLIPFRHGATGGWKTRWGEKSGRRAHRCSKENGCFGVFFFCTTIVGFRLLSRLLRNDIVFWVFGDWKFRWIWLSSIFFLFLNVAKLIFKTRGNRFSKIIGKEEKFNSYVAIFTSVLHFRRSCYNVFF